MDDQRPISAGPASADQLADRHRHHVRAEARRLERELLVWGPMPREHLANRAGAGHWHDGTFQEALQEGERSGILRQLAFGWVAATARLQPSVQLRNRDHS